MAKCNCGGMHREHDIGEGDCYRVMVPVNNSPIHIGDDKWAVDYTIITGTSLREQRMHKQHTNGEWSKVRGLSSENSLPDET